MACPLLDGTSILASSVNKYFGFPNETSVSFYKSESALIFYGGLAYVTDLARKHSGFSDFNLAEDVHECPCYSTHNCNYLPFCISLHLLHLRACA